MFILGLIIGFFIGGAVGFVLAAILAASGKASRAEERLIYEAAKREEQRRGDYLSSKQMVSDVEDILGRKTS